MLDREHATLMQMYRSLRRSEQQIFLLHFAEGMTTEEIAAVMELHPDTVDVQLGRIRVLAQKLIASGDKEKSTVAVIGPLGVQRVAAN